MTREEAIKNLKFVRGVLNDDSRIAQSYDMAISALSEELSEDGTLTVHVSDGSKVSRVLVMGDNIFGGLYYPDSAEGEYIKKEDALAELDKWEWQELYLPIHFKENILDVLPTYSFPDREKGEWIDNGNGSYTCSNCKTEWTTSQIEKMCFCPTCGADMRGET